jgi:hypothetical protein
MGYVYIVNAEGTNTYKIGSTERDVRQRLKELQTGSPVELHVVCEREIEDHKRAERSLHAYFGKSRKHGEWFEIDIEAKVFYAMSRLGSNGGMLPLSGLNHLGPFLSESEFFDLAHPEPMTSSYPHRFRQSRDTTMLRRLMHQKSFAREQVERLISESGPKSTEDHIRLLQDLIKELAELHVSQEFKIDMLYRSLEKAKEVQKLANESSTDCTDVVYEDEDWSV